MRNPLGQRLSTSLGLGPWLAVAVVASLTSGAAGCVASADGGGGSEGSGSGPTVGGAHSTRDAHENGDGTRGAESVSPILYHGGSVMLGTVGVYLIWYGNWTGWKAPTILPDFVRSFGGSPYYAINTTYTDSKGRHVSNAVALAGETTDAYSQGSSLDMTSVGAVVSANIAAGKLPLDANGVYFVLTSNDVAEGTFCAGYCGYHSYENVSGTWIKYSFVGNPARCPSSCEAQSTGPNGSASADAMASILAHELEETTSDPYVHAWTDASGRENADKCAWTWGATYRAANGATANMRLGARDYLIQQNWVNAGGGYCALHYP